MIVCNVKCSICNVQYPCCYTTVEYGKLISLPMKEAF